MTYNDRTAPSVDASTLFTLHRSGQLAASYPLVRRLLSDATDAEFSRAGHILARLDPDEVLDAHPPTPVLKVAVTGHRTLGPLIPPLTAELARHGLLARPHLSGFDSYVFDLGDSESGLYAADPDLVLCVLDPETVFDEVPVPWTAADVQQALEAKVELVRQLAAAFESRIDATLVLNTMPLPRRFTAQLVDHRSRARLGAVWRAANTRLLTLGEEIPSVVTLDVDPLIAEGIPADDARIGSYAKTGLSPALLARYAREVGHLARHLTGRTKKALVCDLDGTLWGGVLGDGGPENLEIGEGLRGEAFTAFQKVVKQLGSQGVLLAVASKNDPEPVEETLSGHPGMTLRPDDFVRVAANWRPKPDNLTDMSRDLSLGADSFVFADDSAFECGLVQHALPGTAVVRLDEEPARHVERLLRDGWFDTRELNAEDRARPTRYREELDRSTFLSSFDSIADYLRELGVWVRLVPVAESEVTRAAQLTLRTNQFNTTMVRYQPSQVRAAVAGPGMRVLGIHAGDRFGDNGMVGVILTRTMEDTVRIDNFVLSCRVFSRGIEGACLNAVLANAKAVGAHAVEAVYRPGPKNTAVQDFYLDHGFTRIGEQDGAWTFRHDLAHIAEPPTHIRFTMSPEEHR